MASSSRSYPPLPPTTRDAALLTNHEEATSTLWNHLQSSCGRTGTAVVVRGFPGAGRTFLLNQFMARTRAADVVTLYASGCATEQDTPFGVIEQLFAGNTAVLEELVGIVTSHPGTVRFPPPPYALRAAQLLVEKALRDLGTQGPVVIAVDDAHHVDQHSLNVLKFLCNRLNRLKVFIVLSSAGLTQRALQGLGTSLMRVPRLLVLQLSPLTERTARQLIHEVTGSQPTEQFVRAALEKTGGNARLLWAVALDTSNASRGTPPERWAPVEGAVLRDTVALMLSAPHADTLRRTTRVVAVLGEVRPADFLSTLCDTPPDSISADLALLRTSGLLVGNHFRTAGIRSAVLQDPSFTHRAELTRQAALQLYQHGAPLCEIARMIAATGRATALWEVTVLREAARQATAENDWQTAVVLLELAHSYRGEQNVYAATLFQLTCTKWMVDTCAASSHLTDLLSEALADRLRTSAMLFLVHMLAWHGRLSETGDLLALLLERHDEDPQLLDMQLALLRKCYGALPQDGPPVPPGHVSGAAPLAFDLPLLCESGAETADTHRARAQKADSLAKAWHGEDPTTIPTLDWAFQTLRLLCDASSALPALPYVDSLFSSRKTDGLSPFHRMLLNLLRAVSAFAQGDLPTAETHARASLVQPQNWGALVGLPLGVLVLALSLQGKHDDAAEVLSVPVPPSGHSSHFGKRYAYASAHHHLMAKNPGAALQRFHSMRRLQERLGGGDDLLCSWQAGAAAACLALGRQEQAVHLAEEVLAQPGEEGTPGKLEASYVIAQTQSAKQRLPLLRKIADLLEGLGNRVGLARVQVDLARTYYSLGDPKTGRALTRRALIAAQATGSENIVRERLGDINPADPVPQVLSSPAARRVPGVGLAALPASRSDVASLSQAELRVAGLAAVGYSNREIASKLFVTVSTVEQHLTRIYRKLKVKSRSELAATMSSVLECEH
ncbi:LuxR C-terminal-related transcriptional regulator [Streptomyces humidus]|nr:helix-turn-helix transcriptional regulator [Streptomyces humidus]